MRQFRFLSGLLSVVFCSSTASLSAHAGGAAFQAAQLSQPQYAEWVADEQRLLRISFPLFCAAARVLGSKHCNFGLALHDLAFYQEGYPAGFSNWAKKHYELESGIYVHYIHAAGPAANTLLKNGDRIYQINGKPVPENAKKAMALIEELGQRGTELRLAVERDGKIQAISIKGVEALTYPIQITEAPMLDLYLDNGGLTLSRTLLRDLDNDSDLALVLAHLIAQDQVTSRVPASVIAAGAKHEIEGAIDELALYIGGTAGYSTDRAVALWTHLGGSEADPRFNPLTQRYPIDAIRMQNMEKLKSGIAEKQRRGAALFPEGNWLWQRPATTSVPQ